MNFTTIRSRIGNYETDSNNSAVSEQLQKLIAKNSLEIFKDIDLLSSEIQKLSLSKTLKSQLTLVFCCSTLPDFILNSKSDLNMVDIDNVVHSVVSSTGLTYKCAVSLIADIFYACGLSFAIECGPQLVNGSAKYGIHALMPSSLADAEVKKTKAIYEAFQRKYRNLSAAEYSEGARDEARAVITAINQLCAAGVSEGYYLLARCYWHGECGTAVDKDKALQLMKISAEQGNAEASASLGDLFYQTDDMLERDYTLAHHYYTRPGALALGKTQQAALQDIYRQKSANKVTLLFSVIVFILTVGFVTFFHTGIFSGLNILVVGIIMIILSLISAALTVIYHIRKRYNGIRWLIAVQFFIWSFYAFILVLA